MNRIFRFLVVYLLTAIVSTPLSAETTLVAAASNVVPALDAILAVYYRDTGKNIRYTSGSSGNLMHQITRGAPFQVFLSADENYVDRLHRLNLTRREGKIYALGKLGIFIPRYSTLANHTLASSKLFDDARMKRLAIANPEHAPYGRAAKEVLQNTGAWDHLQHVLIVGENAAQALQFALTGGVQGAIIPASLMTHQLPRDAGVFLEFPSNWHQPLRQKVVLLKNSSPDAEAFFVYLTSARARPIWRQNGYDLPDP